MTVSEYRKWLSEQQEKTIAAAMVNGHYQRNIGRMDAFYEALKKLPDSFEPEMERPDREVESRLQSITDKMENLKKQLKESKERADDGWERVRYLERKLRDVESLNDQLLRELARRQYKEETGE